MSSVFRPAQPLRIAQLFARVRRRQLETALRGDVLNSARYALFARRIRAYCRIKGIGASA